MRTQVALPVRFVCLEESLQTTTRDLALEGAFIRCVEPPGLGTRLVLQLQFKGGPADTFAEVDEVVIDPLDPGFFARFVQPGLELLDRVSETLVRVRAGDEAARVTDNLSTSAGATRRASTRFDEKLVVMLGGRGTQRGVFAHNISASGLFVLMPNPPAIGTLLELELELPDQLPKVSVRARVVRVLDAAAAAGRRTSPGAGLVFMGGNDEFRQRYTAYLAALSKAKK